MGLSLLAILESAASSSVQRLKVEAVLVVVVESGVSRHVHGFLTGDPDTSLQLWVLLHFLLESKLLQKLSSCTSWSYAKGYLLNGLVDIFMVALPKN